MKKILLVEFNTWHIECLYAQLRFLSTSGYHTILVCDERMRDIVEKYDFVSEFVYYDFRKLSSLLHLRSFILDSKIDKVIFNTAQGSLMLKFILLPFWNKVDFYGIIHDTRKLTKSWGQKIISSKMKSYYVLAGYMLKNIPSKSHRLHKFSSAFFPPFAKQEVVKPKDELWVCIPGTIEYQRRDYDYLLPIIEKGLIPDNVKFILLGNANKGDGLEFMEKIRLIRAERFFISFDSFVPEDQFFSFITASDYLLPLIHPNTNSATDYTKYKISGIFTLSQVFNKIMLVHALFSKIEDFHYPALFYKDSEELIDYLNGKNIIRQEDLPLDFELERKKYISSL